MYSNTKYKSNTKYFNLQIITESHKYLRYDIGSHQKTTQLNEVCSYGFRYLKFLKIDFC